MDASRNLVCTETVLLPTMAFTANAIMVTVKKRVILSVSK